MSWNARKPLLQSLLGVAVTAGVALAALPSASAALLTWDEVPQAAKDRWPLTFVPLEPNLAAYAAYRYVEDLGLEGDFSDLYKGVDSLLDETSTGLSSTDPPFDLVGQDDGWTNTTGTNGTGGWILPPNVGTEGTFTFFLENQRVSTNVKQFVQTLLIAEGEPVLAGTTITTEDPGDAIEIFSQTWDPGTRLLTVAVSIVPQPALVFAEYRLQAGSDAQVRISEATLFDQCSPFNQIPEPASFAVWGVLGLTLGAVGCWRRNRVDDRRTRGLPS